MDTAGSTGSARLGDDPDAIEYTTEYVRRLLAEAVFIYAAIENPGGSVILTNSGLIDADRTYEYSSRIGNPFHLDLIDLMQKMDTELSKGERDSLIAWASGLTQKQAAIYLQATGSTKLLKGDAIRKRRERGIKDLTESFNEEENDRATGEDSIVSAGEVSEESQPASGDNPTQEWNLERASSGARERTRITRIV